MHKIKKKSLILEITILTVILILVPSGLIMLFFTRTVSKTMMKQAEKNADYYIYQTELSMTNTISSARNLAFSTLSNGTIRQYMISGKEDTMTYGRSTLASIAASISLFDDNSKKNAVNAVYLFRDNTNYISYSSTGTYYSMNQRFENALKQFSDKSSSSELFFTDESNNNYAYFVLDYKNIDTLKHLGKIIVELDVEKFVHADQLSAGYPGSLICLEDDQGKILYPADGSEKKQKIGSAGYSVVHTLEDYPMTLSVSIPQQVIYGDVTFTTKIYMIFTAVVLCITVIFAMLEYKTFIKEIRKITDVLKNMFPSGYTERIPQSRYKELSEVSDTFNDMADNLQRSFEDAYHKGELLTKSESQLLAAQINPHFIFNVLETISMKCVNSGQRDISNLVINLAELLRGNIGAGKDQMTTINQELKYVYYYMELQRSRFGNNLQYSVDYENDTILSYYLPRLTIQPLVENSVVHGLEPKSGLGKVSVRIWEEDDMIYLRIEDNGVGFDLSKLDDAENRDDGHHNRVAISNIRRRLDLIYKDKARMEISSKPGIGTKIVVIIPMKEDSRYV